MIVCSNATAQSVLDSVIVVNDNQYVISKMLDGQWLQIRNNSNSLHKADPCLNADQKEWGLSSISYDAIDQHPIRYITKQVLGEMLHKAQSEVLIIFFSINEKGVILEMDFSLRASTVLPIGKLARLEERLKKEYTFNMKDDKLKGISFIRFCLMMRLGEL